MAERLNIFFGESNILLNKFLYRFLHVKRIPPGKMKAYLKNNKINNDVAEQRQKGIPQGGVLSGLLANVFLFNFDMYIVNELVPKYDFKYFRYADDFVLMFKDSKNIHEVYKLVKYRLQQNDKLHLHEIGEKTKLLDLSPENCGKLDFLGFEISPNKLRIKNDNILKFKSRIVQTLNEIEVDTLDGRITWDEAYFRAVVMRINNKIVGLEDLIEQNKGFCLKCHKLIPKRSWMGYFVMVTEVGQLQQVDELIRAEIRRDYKKRTGKTLDKKIMKKFTLNAIRPLKQVTKVYFEYRKQEKRYDDKRKREGVHDYKMCRCERYFDKKTETIKVIEAVVNN